MPGKYVLENGELIEVHDLLDWAKRFEGANTRIAENTFSEPIRVSTVFLGVDHNHGFDGPPQLFETMIFGGRHDQHMERCATLEEAHEMHKRAMQLASS